jgi:hypothetical protein
VVGRCAVESPLSRSAGQYRYRRLRRDGSNPLEAERFQRAQFDGFDDIPLRIIEQQAAAAIHSNPRRTLHVEAAISGKHEFHYQIQVVHFFNIASSYLKEYSHLSIE